MTPKKHKPRERVYKSSGNVFADLGFEDALRRLKRAKRTRRVVFGTKMVWFR